MKNIEIIDKQFVELLAKMPQHWFSEFNAGVRVMAPISYALYQAFCLTYGYELGVFEINSNRVSSYVNKKGELVSNSGWDQFKYDSNILEPIFQREKQNYLEVLFFVKFLESIK